MSKPTLYLMIGYPGAGKTSVAEILKDATGARHLWADLERHLMFGEPTHSKEESQKLYEELNLRAGDLLAEGKSVVFDTNFNFREDRRKLREIAEKNGAETVVIWVNVPVETARKRAVGTREMRNGYPVQMSEKQFDSIVSKLEPPAEDEKIIKIDGTDLDRQAILKLFSR